MSTYARIADDLRRRIVSGELAHGESLPSRHALAEQYEAAPGTAAMALRQLVAEGYVVSRSGSGTYVRQRPPIRRMTRSWYREARDGSPFAADMAAQGMRGGWSCESEATEAPEHIAERLAIRRGRDVMRTRYSFTADDDQVMVSESWEPLDITRGTSIVLPEDGPHAGRGVVERMAVIGQDVTYASEIVTARTATEDDVQRLDVSKSTVVMVIQRTYYTGECPVETADIVIPTDRYELAYMIPVNHRPTA